MNVRSLFEGWPKSFDAHQRFMMPRILLPLTRIKAHHLFPIQNIYIVAKR